MDRQHFFAICKHLDADKPIDKLTKMDLDEMIASMRDAGLSSNTAKTARCQRLVRQSLCLACQNVIFKVLRDGHA